MRPSQLSRGKGLAAVSRENPFDLKNIGLALTFLNARTGELTPPGIKVLALLKSKSEFVLFSDT